MCNESWPRNAMQMRQVTPSRKSEIPHITFPKPTHVLMEGRISCSKAFKLSKGSLGRHPDHFPPEAVVCIVQVL